MILVVAKVVTIFRFHNGEREFLLELLLGSLYFRFYVLNILGFMFLRCIMKLSLNV